MKIPTITLKNITEELMTALRNISLGDNLSGEIAKDVLIPAGSNVEVSHSLKVVPKYRIILRKISDGVISDGDSDWTDKAIYLKNNGASDDIITVLIMRE